MTLILFGMKGCGKTYFARKLSPDFIDTDQLIEEKYRLTCKELAAAYGMPFFRACEKEIILSLSPPPRSIIALGGGAILDPDNLAFLKTLGRFVYLKNGPFEHHMPDRLPYYASIPAHLIDLQGKTESQVLQELTRIYHEL